MVGRIVSLRTILGIFLITIGVFLAGIGDITLDMTSFVVCMITNLLSATYLVLVQRATRDAKFGNVG